MAATAGLNRTTQSERREQSRNALLESAALKISRYGYGNLVLDRVAKEAGYSRGALYHLFEDKEDLALTVVAWVADAWQQEVGALADQESDPVAALTALGRGHAVFCRREEARAIIALRLEFGERDHPVGRAAAQIDDELVERCAGLIAAGRMRKSIPHGPPARTLARAFVGATAGVVVHLDGKARADELVAERVVRGLLGLDSSR